MFLIGPRKFFSTLRGLPFSGRKKLLSLPGGRAYDYLSRSLGEELRTVWLDPTSNSIHDTLDDHPFMTELCPGGHEKICWQCLYILQVEKTISEGDIPVAATTNLYSLGMERKYGPGSSEVEGELYDAPLPEGWGQGIFPGMFRAPCWCPCCVATATVLTIAGIVARLVRVELHPLWSLLFAVLCMVPVVIPAFVMIAQSSIAGASRMAKEHPRTRKLLGVGCRWERRYLDSLSETVLVVAKPPGHLSLVSSLHLFVGLVVQMGQLALLVIEGLGRLDDSGLETQLLGFVVIAVLLVVFVAIVVMSSHACLRYLRLRHHMQPLLTSPKYLSRGGGSVVPAAGDSRGSLLGH